jgi:hypothetical protein
VVFLFARRHQADFHYVIDKLLGHHLPPIGWTKLRQPPLARRLIVWNIQNSTIIQVPAAHGHLKIHIVALSRFAVHRPCISDRALRQLHPSNHKGRAENAMHTRALRRIPALRPKKDMCILSHCVTHLASMRAGDCRGAVTRHRFLLNRIAVCGLG